MQRERRSVYISFVRTLTLLSTATQHADAALSQAYKSALAQGLFNGTACEGCLLAIVGSGEPESVAEICALHDPEGGVHVYNKVMVLDA